MFRNYMKIAFRNLVNPKKTGYALLNVAGLAVGMASVILIWLFVQDELSYDRFHENSDRIYRIAVGSDGQDPSWIGTPAPLAPALKQRLPEIESYARIDPFGLRSKALMTHGGKSFYENRFVLADPALFSVFSFELLQGNPETALADRSSMVISESMAQKYFGEENPLGKTLNYDGKLDFTVSGVMRDVPENSHVTFDFVASFEYLNEIHGREIDQQWGMFNYYTYILLKDEANLADVERRSGAIVDELRDRTEHAVYLQPITEIYLNSKILRDPTHRSDIANVYLYSAIAVIILLIACINFMNLYTANSEVRAREVGMRKVVGARKAQLVAQFLGEAFVLTAIALPLALLLVELILPQFNLIVEKSLAIDYGQSLPLFGGMLVLILFVGAVAGSYPAFFIASFQPIKILKGKLGADGKNSRLRNILVVVQFAVSIVFIAGTFIISDQMQFIRDKKLGYDKENIVNVPIHSSGSKDNYQVFRTQILSHAKIVDATATSFTPSIERWREGLDFEGRTEADDHSFYRIAGDYNFVELFGLEVIAGRGFERNVTADLFNGYVLNETAVREIGWTPEEAIGKRFGNREGRVIGVVKDFNFRSLRQETRPLAINVFPRMFQYISVKIQPGDLTKTVDFLRDEWNKTNPGLPFEYYFYDEEFDKLYKADEKLATVFGGFSGLAVFIACLGLFGLSLFMVQRKMKEIGVRKVLGATVPEIINLLLRNLVKLVVFASIFAWPVAWFVMNSWLRDFAYRVDVSWLSLLLAAVLTLTIAVLTVGYQTIRAALLNPAKVLKYE